MRSTLKIRVSGAAALLCLLVAAALALAAPPAHAAIMTSFDATTSSTQAGAHADSRMAFTASGAPRAKTLRFKLPPGQLGSVANFPTCPVSDLRQPGCPAETQVGQATVTVEIVPGFPMPVPAQVYNMTPVGNDVATLGLRVLFCDGCSPLAVVYVRMNVRPTDYGLTATIRDLPTSTTATDMTLWGVPFDHTGAGQRLPFMTNSAECGKPLATTLEVDSYDNPGTFETYTSTLPPQTGCDAEVFQPSIWTTADNAVVNSPSGFTFGITVPQNNEPDGLGTPPVRTITAILPQGLTINPSVSNGLGVCSDAQFGAGSSAPSTCPGESRIGTVGFQAPALPNPQLGGTIYLGSPTDGDRFRVFLEAYGSHVRVKLKGTIQPDPDTGRLTARFDDNPQVPVSAIKLAFRGGKLAPLAMPSTCGVKPVTAGISSWAGGAAAGASSLLQVSYDAQGGACPEKLGFSPSFTAGTVDANAGHDAGFTLAFGRNDVDQELSRIKVSLPAGLLGRLTAVPLCPSDRAAAGTCDQQSLVGDARVWAGAGTSPLEVREGRVYLTEPYRDGDAAGLAIAVHALAGPYDLGTPIVRAGIKVRPDTGLDVEAEPLPAILQGVPLRIRQVQIDLGLPGFMFNPTDCSPKEITGTVTSADGTDVPVSSPFQVSGCENLEFTPSVSVAAENHSTDGRTGLRVDVRQDPGEAHLKTVTVVLPKKLGARLDGPIQKPCTVRQHAENACPDTARVGTARARTPVLPYELAAPVFFVENPGGGLPRLGVRLKGGPVAVDLVGDVTLTRDGRIKTVFDAIPDVPIDLFELALEGGDRAALTAPRLCGPLTADAALVSQSGQTATQRVGMAAPRCSSHEAASRKPSRKHARRH